MSKKGNGGRPEVDFNCVFGMWPFRKSLNISWQGFEWCGKFFPLRTIDTIRWGVFQRRGGIFPKRTYIAMFGVEGREFTIKTKQQDFFNHLTGRLWTCVGQRLLAEMAETLSSGGTVHFKNVEVGDGGITVSDKQLLGTKSSSYCWNELLWGVSNGSLCCAEVASPDKIIAGLSLLWVDNAHVLRVALELMARRGGESLSAAVKSSFKH